MLSRHILCTIIAGSQEMDLDTFLTAVREGDVQTVRRGLAAGVDVNDFRWFDWTPLHLASEYGQTEVAKLLIQNEANLEARDMGQSTPLHKAAAEGHTGTCELLIRSGADVMVQDEVKHSLTWTSPHPFIKLLLGAALGLVSF
ncbi:myotrophin-like [Branchiostoma floridae]|uniref:Myotrophin-like n=1 Tax=Branchiostoma floridae TaxID=7739 RepID=A0A9J7L855_BRAFL|nr:myotrophin-like [Branchiostoma floridae]